MVSLAKALPADDAELARRSAAGSREAFGLVVARYQSLVASIAFSATGSVSRSEDLAQETFLAAWRQIRDLREPEKLRAWLSGIARNLVHGAVRRDGCDPQSAGEPIEAVAEEPAPGPLQQEVAISREEQAILWRALERIAPAYREPLVLFYREHCSVERVALALDLSEDLVRQRLSRGRKLLQEQVLLFVEGALARTTPGKAFTLGVIAVLPVASGSASAATLGVAATKAGLVAKWSVLSLLLSPLTGVLASYFSVRGSLAVARTERERQAVWRGVVPILIASALFTAALYGLALSREFWDAHPSAFVAIGHLVALGYALWLVLAIGRATREVRVVRAEERISHPSVFASVDHFEYRSAATVFGLPLVHVRFAPPRPGAPPAMGIIAVGDQAVGVIAAGGMAVGIISLGGASAGLVSLGGASFGLLALGGVAIGPVAFGGAAIGILAGGGVAFGWLGAVGGLAAAHDFALGALALGAHENDAAALGFFARLRAGPIIKTLLLAIAVLSIVPTALLARHASRLNKD